MSAACPDDGLVRARRGELPPEEARAVEAHLATCALCRMSAALGRAVGPLPAPDDEDEALARRLLEHQLGVVPAAAPRTVSSLPAHARRWHGRALALGAGLFLLVASAASAAYWTVHLKAARRAASERAAWTPPPAQPRRPAAPPATIGEPLPVPPPVAGTATPGAQPPPPAHPAPRALQRAAVDPEALLRDANEARRARHTEEAAHGYRALQARFPSSREAALSHLSLGNLQLSQGAFADALAQFQAYLRLPGDAADLVEEALLGEARALAALGRPEDERAVWRTLEARFPRSEYSWRARQRLRELDRGAQP